ncbi:uncharacterized protein LOC117102039 [Anneissia japonica]|uniref:uncharacterized protein LOC117102039 n=1 Tax=Anneissia japonica TaxID=1529436 RepID=UPI001425B685|nr:uncharacterized protein LOC117102039 [Anneissia japonica]
MSIIPSCQVSLLVAEDYAMIQGKVQNIPSLRKSQVGRSAYPGNKAYLVVFERAVLLTTLEEDKRGNRTYRTLECCNKNYVDVDVLTKNSSTRPHTFVLYFYKPIELSNSYSSTQYILALIGDEIQNGPIMSDWLKAIKVPEGGGIYATWSRPRYTISQRYVAQKDDIIFKVGDEIEVIEDPDDQKFGWCYVERSHDSRKGWIPKSNLGIQQANEYKTALDLKQQKRLERQNDGEEIKKVKKNRRKTSAF